MNSVTLTAARSGRGRTIHALDLENLAGGPDLAPEQYVDVVSEYRRRVGIRPGDQVFVGASSHCARIAMFALAGESLQWRIRDGVDGADLALLDAIDLQHAARRFDAVVVGSGDHAFLPLVDGALELGLAVVVAEGRSTTAWQLRRSAVGRVRLHLAPTIASAA